MARNLFPAIYAPSYLGGMTAKAAAFAVAWMALLGHRALAMRCDSRLVRAAQLHASYLDSRTVEEIAARANVPHAMHVSRDGTMPNARVRAAGYWLPSVYRQAANNVESCARDGRAPAIVARELADHAEHRDHLLGLGGFDRQLMWGVGQVGADYVVLTAPIEPF